MKWYEFKVRLTVTSDYFTIGGNKPLCPSTKPVRHVSFFNVSGKPVVPGSALRGAVRSRVEYLLNVKLLNSRAGRLKCDERLEASSPYEVIDKFMKRRKLPYSCCPPKRGREEVLASWRHAYVWFESVASCRREDPTTNSAFERLFGKSGRGALASPLHFENFYPVNEHSLKVLKLKPSFKRNVNVFMVEAVTIGTMFEGTIKYVPSSNVSDETVLNDLSLLFFGLGLLKRKREIALGKFKYSGKFVIEEKECRGAPRRKVDSISTFGVVKVEITDALEVDPRSGSVKEVEVEELIRVSKKVISKEFGSLPNLSPLDFDEIERIMEVSFK